MACKIWCTVCLVAAAKWLGRKTQSQANTELIMWHAHIYQAEGHRIQYTHGLPGREQIHHEIFLKFLCFLLLNKVILILKQLKRKRLEKQESKL